MRPLDASDARAEQPDHITVDLYPHQLAALEVAKTLESRWNVHVVNTDGERIQLTTNTATLADDPGYGKTLIALAIAGLDRPARKPHVSGNMTRCNRLSIENEICYSTEVSDSVLPSDITIGRNLAIVPKILIEQWRKESRKTKLRCEFIIDKVEFNHVIKRNGNMDKLIENTDILVISDVFLKTYYRELPFKMIQRVFWDRVFIDEYHDLSQYKRYVMSRFFWAITGTPKRHYCGVSANVLVKSTEVFISESYQMPAINTITYKVMLNGIFSRLYNLLDPETRTLVSTGDFNRALKSISESTRTLVTSEADVMSCMLADIETQIKSVSEHLESLESHAMDDRWGLVDRRYIDIIKRRLENLVVRKKVFDNISEECRDCPICLNEMTSDMTTVTVECGHTFCFECILRSVYTKNTCPVCRQPIEKGNAVVKTGAETQPYSEHATKDEVLEQILQNPEKRKFLVYSGNRGLLEDFRDRFSSETLKCMYLKYHRPNDIEMYVNGDVDVLFITDDLVSGIDLACTTDLVIFNQVPEDRKKQLIGRCNRMGRTGVLNVRMLVNQYEI